VIWFFELLQKIFRETFAEEIYTRTRQVTEVTNRFR